MLDVSFQRVDQVQAAPLLKVVHGDGPQCKVGIGHERVPGSPLPSPSSQAHSEQGPGQGAQEAPSVILHPVSMAK